MKRFRVSILLVASLVVTAMPTANAAVTPGSKCLKAGIKQTYKNKTYLCIRLGKKLYWDNGVSIRQPSQPSPQPSQPSPTPAASINPLSRDSIIPDPVSSVIAVWNGEDLDIKFNWTSTSPFKETKTYFIILLGADGIVEESNRDVFPVDRTQLSQQVRVTKLINQRIFGVRRVNLDSICIAVQDQYYNKSKPICASVIPQYSLNLPTPIITVSPSK
jgi:hypothetical protein